MTTVTNAIIKNDNQAIRELLEEYNTGESRLVEVMDDYLRWTNDNKYLNTVFKPGILKEMANGTGYFDKVVRNKDIEQGIITVTICEDSQRLAVILPTAFGNVILFDRYSHGKNAVVTFNAPREVEMLYKPFMNGNISTECIEMLVGSPINGGTGVVHADVFNHIDEEKLSDTRAENRRQWLKELDEA